jgi:hypothetical protein
VLTYGFILPQGKQQDGNICSWKYFAIFISVLNRIFTHAQEREEGTNKERIQHFPESGSARSRPRFYARSAKKIKETTSQDTMFHFFTNPTFP